jgi:hypothetical protein
VKAFDNAIRLRAFGFCSGVVDILHGEIEFILVMLGAAAIFGAAVGQHSAQLNLMRIEERQ